MLVINNMTSSSALMGIGHFLVCHILFFPLYANKQQFVHGATAVEKNNPHATPPTCSGPAGSLPIVHRHGPCSPVSQKKSPATPSQMILQDERRVQVVNSIAYNRRTGDGKRARDPFLGHIVGANNYIVTVGFGTPIKEFNLILDTGSSITWVRCQSCSQVPCSKQQKKSLYDPSSSSTSKKVKCGQSCHYKQLYLDKSYSSGQFVLDTLTMQPSDVIPDFVFLCAQKASHDFDKAAGILALGQESQDFGSYSFISQTATRFQKAFCYCLPTSTENTTGYLYFGKEAHEKCHSGTYTPLIKQSDASFYYVNLIAITIGKKRLEISSAVSSSPGTIIDSGTIITRLPRSVYSALRSEFEESMSGAYPRADIPDKTLDTCYNLQDYGSVSIPNMVLHFENLDVNLDQTAILWKGKDLSQVCLAFAGKGKESDPTIIGNHQQQKQNILYNIQNRRVEIGPGNC